jgi:hypothetical protein
LERHVQRLDQHIDGMQSINLRFSWLRLGVVIVGSLATWAAATYRDSTWGVAIFAISLLIFSVVALLQRRLEDWMGKFQIWREIKADQIARMRLDWEAIPTPPLPVNRVRSSLEIDLDLTGNKSLHQLIDMAVSNEGSQRLANWLAQPKPNPKKITSRQRIVNELASRTRFRERNLLAFKRVSKGHLQGDRILAWLSEDYPAGRLKWGLPIAAFFTGVNLLLFILNSLGVIPPYWILSIPLYLIFHTTNVKSIEFFLGSVVRLDDELDKFKAVLKFLECYPYRNCENLAKLCEPFREPGNPPSVQLRKVKLVTAAVGLRSNPVLAILLNIFIPWDYFFALLAQRYRKALAQSLPVWLDTWYELEALISLASFSYLNPEYSFPEIKQGLKPVVQAQGLGHPLLPPEEKVCNDITTGENGEIAIITGSNMAGKSTFIKTIGINLCLAYAGGPVNASQMQSLPFRLHTCIRISDSISDGFSYFYAEVKCLKKLLEKLESDLEEPLLYLIDEIFRGTNNRERLIGSRAYIQELVEKNGTGFLATHDLELISLSQQSPKIRNYHFRDQVRAGKLVFEYKIHTGPSPTTNALKIMQLEGLPVNPEMD